MKKIVPLVILLSFISVFVFCQEDTSLRQLLNIDVKIFGYGSVNSLSDTYDVGSYEQVRTWTPFLGITKISEVEFFNLAGYAIEAEQAKKYAKTKAFLSWGGLGAAVLGLLIDLSVENTYFEIEVWTGILIIGGGMTFLGGAFGKNWATVGQAQYVADEYNAKIKSSE